MRFGGMAVDVPPAFGHKARMDRAVTLSLLAAFAAVALAAGWAGARPYDPAKGPRLVPWRYIMVTAAAGFLLVLVHLVNLLGMATGRP